MAPYRQIIVAGSPVGMQQLDAIFEMLRAAGYSADTAGLDQELLQQVAKHNYIPSSAKAEFATALQREYVRYLDTCNADNPPQSRPYGTWHGYPREQIPWFPSINDELCNGCGVCLRLCSTQALVSTPEGKVTVDDPFRCIVGCSSCANVCRPRAITFPPRSMLQAYQRRF